MELYLLLSLVGFEMVNENVTVECEVRANSFASSSRLSHIFNFTVVSKFTFLRITWCLK